MTRIHKCFEPNFQMSLFRPKFHFLQPKLLMTFLSHVIIGSRPSFLCLKCNNLKILGGRKPKHGSSPTSNLRGSFLLSHKSSLLATLTHDIRLEAVDVLCSLRRLMSQFKIMTS